MDRSPAWLENRTISRRTMKFRSIRRPLLGKARPRSRGSRALTAVFALALVPACGAAGESPGKSDTAVETPCPDGNTTQAIQCPAASEKPDPAALIDDLEDEDAFVPTVGDRSGAWWTAGDDTVGATIVPPNPGVASPEAIENGRCDSKFAMRVTGQGFLDWGSLLGLSLAYGKRTDDTDGDLPYDASAYSGIEFWARIGDTSTDRVRFALNDSNSDPYGGVCTDDPGSAEQCYDTFGAYLNGLSPDWRHYRIPFTSLGQRHFGYPAAAAATNALFSVQFNFDPSSVFDFWVDDIAFY